MKVLTTPSECFDNLKDYSFKENYITIQVADDVSARMHYVDENSESSDVVLLLHGEPTWSYLYRHMIPILAKAGKRVIAPDLIGFGKSDKLSEQTDYTYERHVAWTRNIIEQLNLTNITFFGQDWGGLIGLRLVADMPDAFNGMVLSNTALPIGKGSSEGFESWKNFCQTVEKFNSGRVVFGGCVSKIDEDETAAYNAPFPDDSYTACARHFPTLVPVNPDNVAVQDNIDAWEKLKTFNKPTLTLFGSEDKIFLGGEKILQKLIPGAQNMDHKLINAGHFSQEDQPEELANGIINLFNG